MRIYITKALGCLAVLLILFWSFLSHWSVSVIRFDIVNGNFKREIHLGRVLVSATISDGEATDLIKDLKLQGDPKWIPVSQRANGLRQKLFPQNFSVGNGKVVGAYNMLVGLTEMGMVDDPTTVLLSLRKAASNGQTERSYTVLNPYVEAMNSE
jgi:hypothetical protein